MKKLLLTAWFLLDVAGAEWKREGEIENAKIIEISDDEVTASELSSTISSTTPTHPEHTPGEMS